MSDYSYQRFTAGAYDLDSFTAPEPGSRAPDADVSDLDGNSQRLLDFAGRFLVLELGSITCPLFQSRRAGMAQMVGQYPKVSFAILYIREAHPGSRIVQHRDKTDKTARARSLRETDAETRPILIDDMEGTAHNAYGGYPNSVFIINRAGCVVYRSDWNNPTATRRALRRLLAGKAAGGQGLFLPAKPPVAIRTLKRAGGHTLADFLKDLPSLVWKNAIKRNIRLLTGTGGGVAPDHTC
jgi:iodothyronine deiodinase-like protein